jgi:hypothetical protein
MPADPWYINASAGAPSYAADELRRLQSVLLSQAGTSVRFGARAGLHPASGNVVTLSGTTITVQNLKGVAYPGLTTTSGPYIIQLPSRTHTLTAADAANPRKDIVVLRVWDNDEDASGLRQADTEYVVGSPAASPAEPSLPANSFRIATIDVPTNNTAGSTVTNNYPIMSAAGGVQVVRNDAELIGTSGGVYDGLLRWNQATDSLEVHNGASTWETIAGAGILAPGTVVAHLRRTTAVSLTSTTSSSTATAIPWNLEVLDRLNGHDNAVNPTRYTPNVAGWYRISGMVSFEGNTGGTVRGAAWRKNGAAFDGNVSRDQQFPTGTFSSLTATANAVDLAVSMNGSTDYIELAGLQDSGAGLNTSTGGFDPSITVVYGGPL